MNSMKFTHTSSLRGELTVPGDKSISHRSVMFGALADGLTEIHGFLQGADCLSTISCFSKMGISIENQGETVLVHGRGLHGLTAPDSVLDCGNSGTTTRLISGILSAQKFDTTLTGRRFHPETSDEAHHRSSLSDGRKDRECQWKWLRAAPYHRLTTARHPL